MSNYHLPLKNFLKKHQCLQTAVVLPCDLGFVKAIKNALFMLIAFRDVTLRRNTGKQLVGRRGLGKTDAIRPFLRI